MLLQHTVVKKLERLEMAWLRILHRLRFRIGFSDPETAPTILLLFYELIDYRESKMLWARLLAYLFA